MKSFVGILFCGGKGTRLGEITKYTSKAFVPVYNKPSFMYSLEKLEESKYIDRIIILTNTENESKLNKLGHRTIIQDDTIVHDMFSGLNYIRSKMKLDENIVLMPCDNISNIDITSVINFFLAKDKNISFCISDNIPFKNLKKMGVIQQCTSGKYEYCPKSVSTALGVLAPIVLKNEFLPKTSSEAFNFEKRGMYKHRGYWFDVGDVESLLEAGMWIKEQYEQN